MFISSKNYPLKKEGKQIQFHINGLKENLFAAELYYKKYYTKPYRRW